MDIVRGQLVLQQLFKSPTDRFAFQKYSTLIFLSPCIYLLRGSTESAHFHNDFIPLDSIPPDSSSNASSTIKT